MILVISSTNRPDSFSRKLSDLYYSLLIEKEAKCKLLYLEDLPTGFFSSQVYEEKPADVRSFIDEYMAPADKFVFIVPEYNGSIPGVLKLLIDTVEVGKCFHGKKAGIIGVSSGRTGNLRGIDHLMSVLNHVKVQVMPDQPKISGIESAFDENDDLLAEYKDRVTHHVENILKF